MDEINKKLKDKKKDYDYETFLKDIKSYNIQLPQNYLVSNDREEKKK